MGSRVEVWKLVEPVTPCGSSVRRFSSGSSGKKLDIRKVQEEIAAVDARVSSIDEQISILKAALPELDNKIRFASLGMPTCSFPLDELRTLKAIHFKLLQFWEDMNRKQLEKLECLSSCLQILEEQRSNKKSLPDEIDTYKGIGQHMNEKVQSDIRKNQELEVKLYFDRIPCVLKCSKPTPTLYSPPKRDLQRIPIPSAPELHRVPAPQTKS